MNEIIPPFDARIVFTDPWLVSPDSTLKICLLAAFVFISCALAGNYLILRRMALVGDAMSHSVLPGIVLAFVIANGNGFWVIVGAIIAGLLTTMLIEWIHKSSIVKQDVAIGVTFTTLFAIGVVLLKLLAGNIHIDTDCVLYGQLETAGTDGGKIWISGVIAGVTALLVVVFYKQLLVTSFDPTLASSMGIPSQLVHYGLMAWVSVVVVSAFEAVGSIMVVAMLILPGATGTLLSQRLPRVLALSVIHAVISAFAGFHFSLLFNGKFAAGMVVTGFLLFLLAWLFSPSQGLISRRFARWALRRDVRNGALAES
ncbi:MAG: manganese/zinc/iron transport system permease protein [Verrucomicrobiales bacterium]|jgi:manganese/zinc/iron transport system permease protein